MSDIVERLRDVAGFIEKEHGRVAAAACLATEAAARIQNLEAALRDIENECADLMRLEDGETEETLTGYGRGMYFTAKHIKARAALEGK